MTGIVSFLRASGRGRSGWEPATLVVVACLPPVWLCVECYFHPQDLLAMGLALASMACFLRKAWIGAGILIALAILSQQFAVLVAVPLLVLTPPNRRVHFALAALTTCVVVTLPFLVASTRAAANDVLLGTGNDISSANTLLGELHLPNSAIFIFSRLTPLFFSLLLSVWVVRRLGRPAEREPAVLASLVALSLSMRLIFEWSLYGYYFMALAVVLILFDVVRGRIRATLVIWLIVLSLAYVVGSSASTAVLWRVPWRHSLEQWLPLAALVVAVLVVASTIGRRGLERRLLVWMLLAAGVVLTWPSSNDPISAHVTTMELQVLLVLPGIALAALPLRSLVRKSGGTIPPNLPRADVSTAQAR
jgi:hypothetical protein